MSQPGYRQHVRRGFETVDGVRIPDQIHHAFPHVHAKRVSSLDAKSGPSIIGPRKIRVHIDSDAARRRRFRFLLNIVSERPGENPEPRRCRFQKRVDEDRTLTNSDPVFADQLALLLIHPANLFGNQ